MILALPLQAVCTRTPKYPNKDSDLDDILKMTVGEEDGF